MRHRVLFLALISSASVLVAACGSGSDNAQNSATGGAGGAGGSGGGFDGGVDADPGDFAYVNHSCAYNCPPASCSENTTPYDCQNLRDWRTGVPHADTCEPWDGTYPKVVQGKCTVSDATGEAKKVTGPDPDHPGTTILPDGRRVTPAGKDWSFNEPDLKGGITVGLLALPGTNDVLTVDTGTNNHAVRLVDASKIGSGDPVLSYVGFTPPEVLNNGIAFVPPDLVYVATDNGVVQALTLDTTAGTLKRDDTRSIQLPDDTDGSGNTIPWYVSGVAVSPDNALLVITPVRASDALVFDVKAGSPTFGQKLGQVAVGRDTFGAWFDPADAAHVYVSIWGGQKVQEVDVSDPAAPKVSRGFATGMDPEGIAFLDSRWMAVADDLGDTFTLVDRASGTTSTIPVSATGALKGFEPSTLAYDAAAKRLYATLSGTNAIAAYDVDLSKSPPSITPAGDLPTGWWPSGVAVLPDGSLAVANMRARGTGPSTTPYAPGQGDISNLIHGGVEHVPAPSGAALAAGATTVAANNAVDQLAGRPAVTCPAGQSDFPVPDNVTDGSPVIKHVFFILRENKDFDAVLGDMPGVNGDPSLTLKQKSSDMDKIWHNFRVLAKTFAMSDNYYTSAVQSTQGHVWATYGRTNDFNERTWAVSDSRGGLPGGGIIPVGSPVEGSMFQWLKDEGVDFDIMGEGVGLPEVKNPPDHNYIDIGYPGGPVQNIGYNDLEKACHIAGRVRVECDIGNFTYMTITNDHTFGLSPDAVTPEVNCAVNDEATGMIVDAISHSPLWKESLILVTEDDPLDGSDHVDSHRTPLVMISPWIKHGYVSHEHIDIGALHRLFANILGKPYPNLQISHSALPLDMFTSTPDYTPYTYTPRTWPLECGGTATRAEQELTRSWDFSAPDQQPGLSAQVMRWMRGKQLQKLTPELEAQVAARLAAKQAGLPAPKDSDDE